MTAIRNSLDWNTLAPRYDSKARDSESNKGHEINAVQKPPPVWMRPGNSDITFLSCNPPGQSMPLAAVHRV